MSDKKTIDKKLLIWKIATIAISVLFIPIIIFNMFFLVATLSHKDRLPTMFGYGMVMVLSDSMKGEFETNDAIFIKKVEDASTLAVGNVICYRDGSGYTTHRINSIKEENGQIAFVTKGDANNTVDRESVTANEIQGIYVGKLKGFYGLVEFLQSPLGVMLLVIIPCLVYARYEVYLWQKKKEEELAETKNDLQCKIKTLVQTEVLLAETQRELSEIKDLLAPDVETGKESQERHYTREDYLSLPRKKKKKIKKLMEKAQNDREKG